MVENAKEILLKAWSMHLAYIGAALSVLEILLPQLYGVSLLPPFGYAATMAAIAALQVAARVTKQKNMKGEG